MASSKFCLNLSSVFCISNQPTDRQGWFFLKGFTFQRSTSCDIFHNDSACAPWHCHDCLALPCSWVEDVHEAPTSQSGRRVVDPKLSDFVGFIRTIRCIMCRHSIERVGSLASVFIIHNMSCQCRVISSTFSPKLCLIKILHNLHHESGQTQINATWLGSELI